MSEQCDHVWERIDDTTELCFLCDEKRPIGKPLMDIFADELSAACPPDCTTPPTGESMISILMTNGESVEIPYRLFEAANDIAEWFVRQGTKQWALGPVCSRSYEIRCAAQLETLQQIKKLVSPEKGQSK